jgi:predicted dehydrogenase
MTTGMEPAPRSPGAVRWGILATGGIARLFTRDLLQHGHQVPAVGSRSARAAQDFADEFGIGRSHGSYDDLVADPGVDVVYVATPHSLHAENAIAALEHGKHVLVEKAFTMNARQARAVAEAAASRNLLVMEAMWTRFLPHMVFLRSALSSGAIGEVRSLHARHTQQLPTDPSHRLNRLDLAGGALLDLGVYPLSFAHDVLGPPVHISAAGSLSRAGVDVAVGTVLRHREDAISTSYSSMETRGPNFAEVLGTKGRLAIDPVWYGPSVVTLYDDAGTVVDRFDSPVSGRGMQYQAAEVERILDAGETTSPLMAPEDSIAVMETMDAVRAELGVRYPGE